MAVEGLQIILDKEAVVPTPTADRLITAPDAIEAAFLYHVRSYVPFGREAGSGDSDTISMADYEKRLIEKVKANLAPKGYITADFGYGKTSTALYIWDRCRKAGLLAVPPFQLGRLDDLIHASYGWTRHELNRTAPALVPTLEALYAEYRERSIESMAGGDAVLAKKLREFLSAGILNLDFVATDYATYFERLAQLVEQAGFAGVVVLADELQQYLDPAIRGGRGDPIAPLFNIVEALNTRRGRLPVGLIFSLLRKDFGVINDQRGDFIMRLKMDGLGLDLSTIYDKRFATRLWRRLAKEFSFTLEEPRIVTPAALDALGQIAARDDLANGPRTVIDAFRWMTRRFLDGASEPVTPLDLVDAFLTGQLVFDGTSELQTIIQKHLETPLVNGRDDLRRVVKALAAFPTDGAMEPVLRELDLWEGTQELDRLARGDITIMVGGGLDERGERVPYGYTLRGLEPQSAIAQDWLTQTLREFSRTFVDSSDTTLSRMEAGFSRMLSDIVFRPQQWKRVEANGRRRSDGANRTLLFEGSFPATQKRFPERRVLVRVLREGERPEPIRHDVDVTLDVNLALHLDKDDRQRRALGGTIDQDGNRQAHLILNLFHREREDYYPDLQEALQPVVSPNRVTPLLMLALHEYLEEKRHAFLIPKENDREIEAYYQPRLLEHSAEELLNAELGASFNARGPRVIEELFRTLVEARLPSYKTLIRQSGWPQALADYRRALESLETRHERQGAVEIEITKEELARLFTRSNPSLDSFLDNFPELITVEPAFKGRQPSKVRFRLHPFEEYVRQLLRSGETTTVAVAGRKVPAKVVKLSVVEDAGAVQGYRPREIGEILNLMTTRELVEVSPQQNIVQEVAHVELGVEDLARRVSLARQRIDALLIAYPADTALTSQLRALKQMDQELNSGASLDDGTLLKRDTILRNFDRQLTQFLTTKLDSLRASAKDIVVDGAADPRQSYRLADAITGEFFAPQIDVIRKKLLTEADTYRAKQDNLKKRIITAVGQLNAEAPTVEGVIEAQEEVVVLRREAQRVNVDGKSLDERSKRLMTARRILGQAVELRDAMKMIPSAVDDPELGVAFDIEVAQIRAELSSRKETALESVERWEASLGEIRNRFTARQNAARDDFAARHARYINLLHAYSGMPPEVNAIPVVFNAADPAGSGALLASTVSSLLGERLDRISTHAGQYQAALRQLLTSGELQFVDDPRAQESLCRTLIEGFSEIIKQAATLHERASDRTAVDEVDGEFVTLLEDFQSLLKQVERQFKDAEKTLTAVRLRQLDDREQRIFDRVQHLASVNGTLDVGMLLEDEAIGGTRSQDDVWDVLEQLYRKRRVSVHVDVHRGLVQS